MALFDPAIFDPAIFDTEAAAATYNADAVADLRDVVTVAQLTDAGARGDIGPGRSSTAALVGAR